MSGTAVSTGVTEPCMPTICCHPVGLAPPGGQHRGVPGADRDQIADPLTVTRRDRPEPPGLDRLLAFQDLRRVAEHRAPGGGHVSGCARPAVHVPDAGLAGHDPHTR